MKALTLLVALALTVLAASVLTTAQPRGKLPVVGVLDPGTSDALSDRKSGRLYAFLQGLRELGYIEEQTLHLEYRFADEQWDRLPALAAELVQLKPDIIVTGSIPAVLAARQATSWRSAMSPAWHAPAATSRGRSSAGLSWKANA